jgi:hypothetical protein
MYLHLGGLETSLKTGVTACMISSSSKQSSECPIELYSSLYRVLINSMMHPACSHIIAAMPILYRHDPQQT